MTTESRERVCGDGEATPRDQVLTGAQTAAAARLVHAILGGGAEGGVPRLVVLVGPAGVGKTLVLERVLARLPDRPRCHICQPGEDLADLPLAGPGAVGASPVVVLDDAHRLAEAGVRRLESLLVAHRGHEQPPAGRPRVAAVVCAGRGRLMTLLARRVGLVSRVGLRATVGPMTCEETTRLVAKTGGAESTRLGDRIHELTGGVPRAILRLCGIVEVVGSQGLSPDDLDRLDRRTSLPAA